MKKTEPKQLCKALKSCNYVLIMFFGGEESNDTCLSVFTLKKRDFGDLALGYNSEVSHLYIPFHCITNAGAGKQALQSLQVTDFI